MNEAPAPVLTLSEKDKARFWAKVNKDGPLPDQTNPHYAGLGPCWVWTSGKCVGYGVIKVCGKVFRTHRFSWMIHNGQISNGIDVCHKCDNPACCNPAHLFLGTDADNMRDRENKGRGNQPCGIKVATAKLTADNVVEIRALYAAGGTTLMAIGAKFGVQFPAIYKIITRKTWAHLPV